MKLRLSLLLFVAIFTSTGQASSSYSAADLPCDSVNSVTLQANMSEATYTEKTQTYYYYRGQIEALKSLSDSQVNFKRFENVDSTSVETYVIELFTAHQDKDLQLLEQKIKNCEERLEELTKIINTSDIPACVDKTAQGVQDTVILGWDCTREERDNYKKTVGAFHIQRANLMDHFIRGRLRATYDIGSHIRGDGRTVDASQWIGTSSNTPMLMPWTYEMNMAYPIFAKTESDFVACHQSTSMAISIYELQGSHCSKNE